MESLMDDFKDLTNIIGKLPVVQPPEDLTPRVVMAIQQIRSGFYSRTWKAISRRRTFSLNPSLALRGQSNHKEIFIYFMIIAAAHLAFALVLLAGFRSVNMKMLLPSVILFQPLVMFFLAGCLILGGLFLRRNTLISIRISRAATIIYMEAVIINGILLCMEVNRIIFLIPFITVIAGGTLTAGIFLALISTDNTLNRQKDVCPGAKIP